MLVSIVVILAIVFGAAVIAGIVNRSEGSQSNLDIISGQHPGWGVHYSNYDQTVVGISPGRDEILLGRCLAVTTYPISAIASVEVLRDGISITTTDRGSQAVGAFLGGLLFGGPGLVAGALSGKSRTEEQVRSIGLQVIVDDHLAPVHTCNFFLSAEPNGSPRTADDVAQSIFVCDRYYGFITNAMRGAATVPSPNGAPILASDELARLWDLKVAGALTSEEFTNQKARLIGGE